MTSLIRFLSAAIRRAPIVVVVVGIAITAALAAFIPQDEVAPTIESFAPDAPEYTALLDVQNRFASTSRTLQVLIGSDTGDVMTANALRAVVSAEDRLQASTAAPYLADRPAGPIVSYLTPAIRAMEFLGTPIDTADDATVQQMYRLALGQMSSEEVEQVRAMLPFSVDGPIGGPVESGLMVVFLDTSSLDSYEELEEILRSAAAAVEGATDGAVSLSAFSFELLFSDTTFRDEVPGLFLLATVVIMGILAIVFWVRPATPAGIGGAIRRTVADIALALTGIGMAIAWMMGAGVLLGPRYLGLIGRSSELLQALPILLVGLGVDYAVHLTARYRGEIGSGRSVSGAAGRATATVGIALVLATLTTSIGFLTNVVNPVPALRDFGIMAAVGIASAFLIMLTFVPSVRLLLDRRAERKGTLPATRLVGQERRWITRGSAATAVLAERHPIVVLATTALLAGAGIYGLMNLDTEFSSAAFIPEDAPILQTYATLRESYESGLGEVSDVLIEGEVLTPEAHNALVAALAGLEDDEHVVRQGDRVAALSPVSVLASLMGTSGFAGDATELGLEPALTVRADADVAAIYSAAAAQDPDGMAQVVSAGEPPAVRVAISTTAGEDFARDLDVALSDDFGSLAALDGVTAVVTNEHIVVTVVIDALNSSQISSLAITLIAAMALLTAGFWFECRRPMLGVITIAPVVVVVLWTYGMMAASGIPFGPVTATTAALAIGIGVPYTIHITHRYLEDRQRFDDPADAMRSTAGHTGGALVGSALTTIAGFAVLITSSLTAFQQFGIVTVYAISFALLGSVIVLPSLLVLWDRWHQRRGEEPVERVYIVEAREPIDA
ncbi:MAG: MMPL family transporter [Acidimicrobiia bacterium]|nr:MMPL family transporter [Acidimicrobiia bacterium]